MRPLLLCTDLDRTLRRYRDRFPPVIKKTIDKTHPIAPAE